MGSERKDTRCLYAEWQILSFDPAKMDIEEFMTDVKNMAGQLNYPDAAQVVMIKCRVPIEIYNTCLNIDAWNDLKAFLINVFDNPRIKEQVCCQWNCIQHGQECGHSKSGSNC